MPSICQELTILSVGDTEMYKFESLSSKSSQSSVGTCYYYNFVFYVLYILACKAEKAMAPHSSTLAWKILWAEEPGRVQSMGL